MFMKDLLKKLVIMTLLSCGSASLRGAPTFREQAHTLKPYQAFYIKPHREQQQAAPQEAGTSTRKRFGFKAGAHGAQWGRLRRQNGKLVVRPVRRPEQTTPDVMSVPASQSSLRLRVKPQNPLTRLDSPREIGACDDLMAVLIALADEDYDVSPHEDSVPRLFEYFVNPLCQNKGAFAPRFTPVAKDAFIERYHELDAHDQERANELMDIIWNKCFHVQNKHEEPHRGIFVLPTMLDTVFNQIKGLSRY